MHRIWQEGREVTSKIISQKERLQHLFWVFLLSLNSLLPLSLFPSQGLVISEEQILMLKTPDGEERPRRIQPPATRVRLFGSGHSCPSQRFRWCSQTTSLTADSGEARSQNYTTKPLWVLTHSKWEIIHVCFKLSLVVIWYTALNN